VTIAALVKTALRRGGIHPRRWFDGLTSYSRYLGYIRPQLLLASEAEFRARRQMLAYGWEPRRLSTPLGKRIMVLCPHPDDESIGAGGVLFAHRDVAEIHLVCLCDGAGGGRLAEGDSPNDLVKTRQAEFLKTARDLKAVSVRHCHYPDGSIPTTTEAAEALRAIVDAIRPDVVLLPWFLDGHIDHRKANELYARACANVEAMVIGYEIWSMLEPNAFFDISDYIEAKLSLIKNYPSQLRTVDYVGFSSGLASVRAFQFSGRPLRSGATEAFIALPNREYCEIVAKLRS
jgi:LmbE family N-acetylglucosaminyl deacetylase